MNSLCLGVPQIPEGNKGKNPPSAPCFFNSALAYLWNVMTNKNYPHGLGYDTGTSIFCPCDRNHLISLASFVIPGSARSLQYFANSENKGGAKEAL